MLKRLHLLLALFILTVNAAMAQITTSGISGKISSNGETVIGATVTATHQPSGTVYRAVTNVDGRYTIQGMRPGGPYKVSISYIGYKDKVFNNVSLNLGESQNLSCSLQEGEGGPFNTCIRAQRADKNAGGIRRTGGVQQHGV